jgi:hypothetical protein
LGAGFCPGIAVAKHPYSRSVFINCPFSPDYQPIFRAILFAVYACRFLPRSALEVVDSSDNRLEKIQRIIEESKFGVHDISKIEPDPATKLPRFNMPFELGLFLGAKAHGSNQQRKKMALIFDSKRYRYRQSLSDISGLDIETHDDRPDRAIHEIRNWLDNCRGGSKPLPGGSYLVRKYNAFTKQLPFASRKFNLKADELTYGDICRAMEGWVKLNTEA